MHSSRTRVSTGLMALLMLTLSLVAAPASAHAAAVDGTCVATITLNFSPPATEPLPPPATGPFTTSTGSGTISTCVVSDGSTSYATVTGLVTSLGSVGGAAGLSATITAGRFAADTITIANVRDPLALLACLTTGLAQATGVTSLAFTQGL